MLWITYLFYSPDAKKADLASHVLQFVFISNTGILTKNIKYENYLQHDTASS
jgi:hypothetical protein